jgi:hypothetical protein
MCTPALQQAQLQFFYKIDVREGACAGLFPPALQATYQIYKKIEGVLVGTRAGLVTSGNVPLYVNL